jgi:hypothetical protein
MKKLKKTTSISSILILILFVTSSFQLSAQRAPHEFSAHLGGGYAGACMQPVKKGNFSAGFSADFGVGFTGFVSQQIGFQIGVDFGMFQVKSKMDSLKSTVAGEIDKIHNRPYDQFSTFYNYAEIHKSLYLSIPFMIQFQTKQHEKWNWKRGQRTGFYGKTGVKTLFLLNQKYDAGIRELYNLRHYTDLDNWAGTQEFVGLGKLGDGGSSGSIGFNVLVMFAIEAGMKWRVQRDYYLYVGVYYECGLYDPSKSAREPISEYTSMEKVKNLPLLKVADRNNLMTAGVRFRFAFTQKD